MDLGLKDKVIVITGGGRGIGAAIVEACAREGAVPVIVTRPSAAARALAARLAHCELIETEVDGAASCRSVIETALQRRGRIDALVNNAGFNDKVGLEAGSPAAFQRSLESGLIHYYAMTHYALPALKAARGAVVNISSKTAVTGQGGTSGYVAAKAAQLGLTREWAAELLPYGIRVNAVIPAEVTTPQYQQWLDTQPDPEAARKAIADRIPLDRRFTTPEEIASTVVFLLSPQSSHTTGQHVFVEGGYTHVDRAL